MKKLCVLICLIFIATVVNAASLSVNTQPNEITLQAGSNKTVTLNLHSDTIPLGVNIYVNEPYSVNAYTNKSYFYMNSNDTSTDLYVYAPWDANPGDYYIEIEAYSSNESAKAYLLLHITERPEGPAYVNFTYEPEYCVDLYRGESKIFNLWVENVGPSKSFNFAVEEQPDDVETIITPFSYVTNMGSGEKINRIATVKVGDEADLGEQSVLVELREKSTDRLYSTVNLCLNVMEREGLLVSASPEEIETYGGETVEGTVIVKNTGDKAKDLILSSTVDWAKLSENSVRLKPGETKEINLTMQVPTDLEKGKYGVRVTVKNDITRAVTFYLNVLKEDVETSSTVSQSEMNTKDGKQNVVDAVVTFKNNTESSYENAEIRIDDLPSGWKFTSEVSEITINPKEEKSVHVYITPNESVTEPKTIHVSLYENGSKVAEETVTIGEYNVPAVGMFSLGMFSIESVIILFLATGLLYLAWDRYKDEIISRFRKERPVLAPEPETSKEAEEELGD
ncbi:MAG: hypothetical protein JXA43_03110 [Candidatus Diapherotrites archaeon]|nr:hypothetical protein [Candidatus Diapherotrites archaeon]